MIHQKFPRKSTEFKIVEQDKCYEIINRKYFQIRKRKDKAPRLEIRSKDLHGGFIVEEVHLMSTVHMDTTENSSEASEYVETSTNEEMETTDENSNTEGLNDSNENDENSDAEEIGSSNEQGYENSDTENSG